MSFYKEVPGRKTTLESTLKFDTTPTAGSTNPVTSDGVANTVTDILDDHATAVIDEKITVPTAEAANYTVGNFFEQNGEIWKCTAKTNNGDGTWTIKAEKVNGIVPALNSPNIKNVQSDWNQTNDTEDDFIKNKPYYTNNAKSTYFKVCSFLKTGVDGQQANGLEILSRYFQGAVHGRLLYKAGFTLYYEKTGNVSSNNQYIKFHWIENGDYIDIYAQRTGYTILHVSPLVNQPKYNVDFTSFGTAVTSLPDGATEITPVWEANAAASSGTAPVKVDSYGALTPVPMDNVPTEGSTNLMTSGAIKTALDQLSARIDALK